MNKYSIIVPAYQSEKYIANCIISLKQQSYQNFEVIIINDGSTDNTLQVITDIVKQDERFKVISISNEGVSNARNIGLKEAKGDYITFVDADDYIEKDTLRILNDIIERENCDIVKYGYVKEINLIKKRYQFSIKDNTRILKKDYEKEIYPYIFTTFDLSNIWNAFFSTKTIKDLQFDSKLTHGEDFKFMVQAVLKSQSFFIITEPLYHYVYHSKSAVNKQSMENVLKSLEGNIICCLDVIEQLDRSEEIKNRGIERIQSAVKTFCAFIASNNHYVDYVKKIQVLIEEGRFQEIEKRYEENFKQNIWQEILTQNYYHELRKFNTKRKWKKYVLELLGG